MEYEKNDDIIQWNSKKKHTFQSPEIFLVIPLMIQS